ncbi:MAG: EamA family transporter [Saprospiraceae bacterium]|nr:EamA family transporter [Candidatus Brachybacter algidus]
MNKKTTPLAAYIYLHIAVLAYGFTAILGALIHISPMALVWWRLIMTLVALMFFFRPRLSEIIKYRSYWLMMALTGVIIALHWVCFYTSIKIANASIAVVVLSVMPFFTSILDPLINKSKFQIQQMVVALLIIPGMALIFNNTAMDMKAGVWVGILAALLSSIYTVLSKKLVDNLPVKMLSFVQLAFGLIIITLLLPLFKGLGWLEIFVPTGNDWIYLIVLSVVCTAMAFVFTAIALKALTPFIVNLSINLEPVYGVILAIIILHEDKELNSGFYLGMSILLAAVFLYPLSKNYKKKKLYGLGS